MYGLDGFTSDKPDLLQIYEEVSTMDELSSKNVRPSTGSSKDVSILQFSGDDIKEDDDPVENIDEIRELSNNLVHEH